MDVELQTAIYQRLTQAPVSLPDVYDAVPQDKPGLYSVIGDTTASNWDTDDANGKQFTVTIYTYNTNQGEAQTELGYRSVKLRMRAIYDALHLFNLPVTGYNALKAVCEFEDNRRSADGISRQGIQRFRILIHE